MMENVWRTFGACLAQILTGDGRLGGYIYTPSGYIIYPPTPSKAAFWRVFGRVFAKIAHNSLKSGLRQTFAHPPCLAQVWRERTAERMIGFFDQIFGAPLAHVWRTRGGQSSGVMRTRQRRALTQGEIAAHRRALIATRAGGSRCGVTTAVAARAHRQAHVG